MKSTRRPRTSSGGPSMIVDPPDGKIPYQAWGRQHAEENRKKYVEPNTACFPSGVPRVFHTPTRFEILQSPDEVLFLIERSHTHRIVPITTRPHVGKSISLWVGDSRGRWEGNTLVVDVTSLNDKPWFDQAGNFYSNAAHTVERFTLIDADTIHYAVTIEDPVAYTRPWTMAYPMRRVSGMTELPRRGVSRERIQHRGPHQARLSDLPRRPFAVGPIARFASKAPLLRSPSETRVTLTASTLVIPPRALTPCNHAGSARHPRSRHSLR